MPQSVSLLRYEQTHLPQVLNLIRQSQFDCGDAVPDIGVVAIFNDTVIGYIGGFKSYGANAFISILVVDEHARDMKLGIALVSAMTNHLLSLGIERIEAIVEQDNVDAQALFKSLAMEYRPVFLLEALLDDIKTSITNYNERRDKTIHPSDSKDCQEDVREE